MTAEISRRSFVRSVLAAGSAPVLFGVCAGKFFANRQVNVGIIGCGLIARSTNVPGFLKDPRCRVTVAGDMVRIVPEISRGQDPMEETCL